MRYIPCCQPDDACPECARYYFEVDESECDYDPEFDDSDYGDRYRANVMFADPGGNSALRAASRSNPRNLPCPSCGEPNRLTPADRAQGYQCDACADKNERGLAWDD